MQTLNFFLLNTPSYFAGQAENTPAKTNQLKILGMIHL